VGWGPSPTVVESPFILVDTKKPPPQSMNQFVRNQTNESLCSTPDQMNR
jgi:hypothetical protein